MNAIDPEINSNIVNDEHCVSQGVVPLEIKDIVSNNSQLIELDGIDPAISQDDNDIPLHPSGCPVRKITGKGKPMDEQFIYEL